MNKKQLSEHIGNIDDRLVQQAERISNYAAQHRQKRIRQFLAAAAALLLMVSSFSVGAIAFAHEIIIEVPVEQENVVLEEIGLTLILPDSWKGKYEVIEDIFVPNNSTMWEFCVKSVYNAQTPADESVRCYTVELSFIYSNMPTIVCQRKNLSNPALLVLAAIFLQQKMRLM